MIKNIIFDIGNVLADFCWRKFLSEKGFSDEMVERIGRASVLSDAWVEFDRGVYSDEEVIDFFVKNDPEIASEIHKGFDNVSGMVILKPETMEWINDLHSRGYKLYYLSNYSQKALDQCKDATSFIPYLDGGILSYTVKMTKPDPEIYLLLLSKYGLKAEETVFIDDTKKNIDAAVKLGIHGIQYKEKDQAHEELKKLLKNTER
ncbi:MAG: HAD family phosphatase [Lachnospiraceae bacterium]|nr:HAD family phosphatase [Lachnospiraceae bacterium]